MRIKLDLDEETVDELVKAAEAERRPLSWQAEVLLKRALDQLKENGQCSK